MSFGFRKWQAWVDRPLLSTQEQLFCFVLVNWILRQLLVSWLVTGEEQTFRCAGSELKVLKGWFGVRILQWLWLEGKLWWWDWQACGRNVSWLTFLYIFTTLAWKYCVYTVLFLFNNVIYVFLLLWLRILIVCLCMATLTDVLPCFFLSCKANARVKPTKTGHGPPSS